MDDFERLLDETTSESLPQLRLEKVEALGERLFQFVTDPVHFQSALGKLLEFSADEDPTIRSSIIREIDKLCRYDMTCWFIPFLLRRVFLRGFGILCARFCGGILLWSTRMPPCDVLFCFVVCCVLCVVSRSCESRMTLGILT